MLHYRAERLILMLNFYIQITILIKDLLVLHDVLNGSNNPVLEEIPSKIERSVINKYKKDINIKFKNFSLCS